VPRITLLMGVLLAILGVVCFLYTGSEHYTALIPTAFGAVFMALGLFGTVENLRKHLMHAAAALALLGMVFGLIRVVPGPVPGREVAYFETLIFAVLCGLLLVLCVKSFIDARRRRSQRVEA
jgi:uncharacterized membrane protein HdeD (DUF308 family)